MFGHCCDWSPLGAYNRVVVSCASPPRGDFGAKASHGDAAGARAKTEVPRAGCGSLSDQLVHQLLDAFITDIGVGRVDGMQEAQPVVVVEHRARLLFVHTEPSKHSCLRHHKKRGRKQSVTICMMTPSPGTYGLVVLALHEVLSGDVVLARHLGWVVL